MSFMQPKPPKAVAPVDPADTANRANRARGDRLATGGSNATFLTQAVDSVKNKATATLTGLQG